MGERLKKYYDYCHQMGGLTARMRLTVIVGVTYQRTHEVADTPDLLEKAKAGVKKITNKDASF